MPLSLRCECGAISREDFDPLRQLQAEVERLREAATLAERIVAHGCPTGLWRCIYCNRKIVSTGGEYGLQEHRDDCAWPPFKKAFS